MSEANNKEALALVEDWLYRDSHGFRIPGGEWGLSLLHALRSIVPEPPIDISDFTPHKFDECDHDHD